MRWEGLWKKGRGVGEEVEEIEEGERKGERVSKRESERGERERGRGVTGVCKYFW